MAVAAALHKLFTPVTVVVAAGEALLVPLLLLFSLTHFRCVCFGFAFCPFPLPQPLLLPLLLLLLLLLEPLLLLLLMLGSSVAGCWSSFDGVPGLVEGGSGEEVDVEEVEQDTGGVPVVVEADAGADAAVCCVEVVADAVDCDSDPAKVILTPL